MKYLPEDIVKDWGLSNLSPEEQLQVIDRINRLLFQAMLARCLDLLTEDEENELDLMLDNEEMKPENVLSFLASKIPTFEQIRLEEIENLKRDILVHN